MARILHPLVSGMTFTECPRWHDGRLWFVDFYTYAVYAVTPAGQVMRQANVPRRPGGLGWLPDGRLLVVSGQDRRVLRQENTGALVEHADLSSWMRGAANDMIVTPSGGAYVGHMGFDVLEGDPFAPAELVRMEADGQSRPVSEPLYFPNGCAITADGATLVVAETMGNRISQFAILPGGDLGPRRDWARFGELPQSRDLLEIIDNAVVGADGIAMDADGAVWVADAYHHRAIRVRAGGEIIDEIDVGDEQVYALALGGADGSTLFLCTAPNFLESERSTSRLGRILTTRVDVPGVQAAVNCPG